MTAVNRIAKRTGSVAEITQQLYAAIAKKRKDAEAKRMVVAIQSATVIVDGERVTVKAGRDYADRGSALVVQHPHLFGIYKRSSRSRSVSRTVRPLPTRKPTRPRIDRALEVGEPRSAPDWVLPGTDHVFTDGTVSFEVLLAPVARAAIVKHAKSAATGKETGGTLFGALPRSNVVDVRAAIGPGPYAERTRSSFRHDPVHVLNYKTRLREAGFDYIELGTWHTHPTAGEDAPSNTPGEFRGDVHSATALLRLLREQAESGGQPAPRHSTSIILTPSATRGWDAPTFTPWRVSERKGGSAWVPVSEVEELLSPGHVVERGRVL
jgi:hypothetical protein